MIRAAAIDGKLEAKRSQGASMRLSNSSRVGLVILMTNVMPGCDKLGMGNETPVADGAPAEQQLQQISYMSASDSGSKGRKVYDHLGEARTCSDFELAMRWNRPPNVEGGAFHKKLVYLNTQFPEDLPKETEVLITARIERAAALPSGGAVWLLRMKDGSVVQAAESADFWEKQELDSQQGKVVALDRPTKPGRAFCGQGVYQGLVGKDPKQNANTPLVSMLFSMDREK
jgi:hypothetical protein